MKYVILTGITEKSTMAVEDMEHGPPGDMFDDLAECRWRAAGIVERTANPDSPFYEEGFIVKIARVSSRFKCAEQFNIFLHEMNKRNKPHTPWRKIQTQKGLKWLRENFLIYWVPIIEGEEQ